MEIDRGTGQEQLLAVLRLREHFLSQARLLVPDSPHNDGRVVRSSC